MDIHQSLAHEASRVLIKRDLGIKVDAKHIRALDAWERVYRSNILAESSGLSLRGSQTTAKPQK